MILLTRERINTQITIKGTDHVYLWNVKKNKQNKVFFRIRNQLYKVYPCELRRMFITRYGEFDGTDAIIIFKENAIQPYHPRGINYDQDATLEDLDARRLTYKSPIRGGIFAKLGNSLNGWLWPVLVIGIFGLAVALAFLNGGGI